MEEQRVLGGRYLLKDKVGSGGMASVYRATDQVLDRTVAVKIMLPQYAGDATFAARFKQEAQAAAGLQSPYIVGVYDWGKDGDTYYIVMEYLRGTDLKSGVRSHGALDPKKVAQIGSQICSALSVAHKHEIVHRDIKPQNIMVQPDGNIKVMDFGIARAKNSHLTQDNNVLGTAHYVSPEQARGEELGATSDIYSLGVVMYECATGQVPFDGDDAISVAVKQMRDIPVPPSQINPRVDGDLERIILRCMEKDAANRFQTAEELRQVLTGYLAGRAVDLPEPTHVIGAAATRVMGEATQNMPRPVSTGQTASNPAVTPAMATDPGIAPAAEAHGGMSKGKIAGIVAGVVVALIAAYFAFTSLMGGGKLTVPDVVGKTQEEAIAQLRGEGFQVGEVTQEYSAEYEEGLVSDQTPDGGKPGKKDDVVDLVISKGAEVVTTTVPDLEGATADEAKELLSEAGLTGKATKEASDAEEGTVFWQSKAAGETVDEGSQIEYKISTGPDSLTVPDLTGMTESEVSAALGDNFGVSFEYAYDQDVLKDQVVRWNPQGKQPAGAEITVVISLGSDPEQEKTPIPDLTGMTKAEAERALKDAGFAASVSYDDGGAHGVAEDHVISWSPTSSAKTGSTVNVVVAWTTQNGGSDTGNGDAEPTPDDDGDDTDES